MKFHRQLFWLLIFLLPVQLGRHFWFEWTQVLGLPIDYLSPTIYLTDLLVIMILFFWWLDERKRFKLKVFREIIKNHWWLLAVFVFLLVSVFLAANRGAAFYKTIKILEFALLGFYIAKKNYALSAIRHPLSLAVIYSSLIAISQFIKQASIGGVFWWLGERSFNLITPGIAKAIVSGRLVLRPYATFPHPNVLAGFLLVSGILLFGKRAIYWILVFILALIGLVLSFSRSAWLVGLLVSLFIFLKHFAGGAKEKAILRLLRGGVIILVLFLGIGAFVFFTRQLSGQEALVQRFSLAQIALEMVRTNPLAGVGLNNFIPQLPNYWQQYGMTYWLQPVHNIFLLIAAETGLVGLLIFLWLLILTFRRLLAANRWLLMTALSAILALGLFDHYWFTLQQAQLLLTVVFGLSWRKRGV